MHNIQELDREYLVERCSILNAFLEEIISFDMAQAELEVLDFKFETLTDLEMIPVCDTEKPFNWEDR